MRRDLSRLICFIPDTRFKLTLFKELRLSIQRSLLLYLCAISALQNIHAYPHIHIHNWRRDTAEE